jgi:cyclic pyranopterin phosphate synthase
MMELIDTHGRAHNYLRISLTDRCNLRCTYCMPEHMKFARPAHLLTTPEIIRLAALFVSMGIDKIRLTGGEPLLHKDIQEITSQLSALPGLHTLALTTNGLKLGGMAKDLKEKGLTGVTISLDSLKEETFNAIARRARLQDVLRGIEAAIEAGFDPVKINTVVMAGVNEEELLDFVEWGKDLPVDLRFIEYMPFPETGWMKTGVISYAAMKSRIAEKFTLEPMVGEKSAVGKSFSLTGHRATVSFVSSMTESFCGTCNRLRLTADGNIKACLFDPQEETLRDVMRRGGSDQDLKKVILKSLHDKPEAHPPMEDLLALGNRAMIAIGG